MPGMTAYFGILEEGKIKKGDTVLVSAAAGATGSLATQIAKSVGARVIGIAGGADKCRYLIDGLGLDGAIDYKSDDMDAALTRYARMALPYSLIMSEVLCWIRC